MHFPLRPAIARPRQKTPAARDPTGRRRRGPSCRIPRQRHAVANEFLLVTGHRSYLDSAAAHGITALEAIRDALTGKPWLPPLPAVR